MRMEKMIAAAARKTAKSIDGVMELLTQHDDIPEFDYLWLRDNFGEVTAEMERIYRREFNAEVVAGKK